MAAYFMHFLFASILVSATLLIVMLLKKVMSSYISGRWQYNISLLNLCLLLMPLIPVKWLLAFHWRVWRSSDWLTGFRLPTAEHGIPAQVSPEAVTPIANMDWLQDLAVSVKRLELGPVIVVLMLLWLSGAVAKAIIMIIRNRKLKRIKKSVVLATAGPLAEQFWQCRAELNISRKILCGTSILVSTPMVIGLFTPMVVLPSGFTTNMTEEERSYILLHELIHCKHGDILLNHIVCVMQVIYWHNPLLYVLSKQIRLEREIACDSSVLKHIPASRRLNYGKTLLRFVQILSSVPNMPLSLELGGSKAQIRKRLENIADYHEESAGRMIRSVLLFGIAAVMILCQLPLLAARASVSPEDEVYDFQGSHVVYEDLADYFNGLDGSFVLYNPAADQYTIYNEAGSVKRAAPASTYKLYSTLIALDQGIISMSDSELEWDGTDYPFESWNRDQNIRTAMEHSVTWYFQELDRRVGKKALETYFTAISYGNHNLSGAIDEYWMESSLRISPVEQVELLTRFYQNQMLFQPEDTEAVKAVLHLSESGGASLSGKTGSGLVNERGVTGWFIGYVEQEGELFLFAAHVTGKDGVGGSTAAEITLSILEDKGIYR